MAFYRHFFSPRFTTQDQHSACVSFVDVKRESICLKARKTVEGYRQRWFFMDASQVSPLLVILAARPEQNPGWGHEKLTNPRAEPVLERMVVHGVVNLSGTMIAKEFLRQRITPLQACSRLVWEYASAEDLMSLHVAGLTA